MFFDNFRIQSTPSTTVQVTHYYPFGMEMPALGYQAGGISKNRYLYNQGTGEVTFDTERIPELSMDLTQFRAYDPALGRWWQVDPLADEMSSWTPYNYSFNNPIRFNDPLGDAPGAKSYIGNTNDNIGQEQSKEWFGNQQAMFSNGGGGGIQKYLPSSPPTAKEGEKQEVKEKNGSSNDASEKGGNSNAQSGGGGYDLGRIGNALTAGGVAYYGLEKSINNSQYWVDAKGNIRSTDLLKQGDNGKYVRGVQGLRNSQTAAANAASKYAVAGKVVGGLGMGVTLLQYGTGQISGTEASVDLMMGGIGFTGWGTPISLMYFGGKFLYEYSTDNTLFEKPGGR